MRDVEQKVKDAREARQFYLVFGVVLVMCASVELSSLLAKAEGRDWGWLVAVVTATAIGLGALRRAQRLGREADADEALAEAAR